MSVFSLSRDPTFVGTTHIKDICFSVVVNISWMCYTSSSLGRGFEINALKKSLTMMKVPELDVELITDSHTHTHTYTKFSFCKRLF